MDSLIYFDNAATTFPKPACVSESVSRVISSYCANPGRSSHSLSLKASEAVYTCREKLADMFGGAEENVVFTSSATHAINTALKSVLKHGDHVLISDMEHNAVYRPIEALKNSGKITYDVYTVDQNESRMISEIALKIRPTTALICACHHSNICNTVTNIESIGRFCREKGIYFLVDASQSAGIIPINMERQKIDILCAPAHKGLYGIPGCGFAIFGDRLADGDRLSTFIEGGNGVDSKKALMPEFLPERLEAGTLPIPAIVALESGIDFVNRSAVESIARKEARLCSLLRCGLSKLNRIRIHSATDGSIMLFSVNGVPSEEFARELDRYGICVRAGMHCAPLAHLKLGTPDDGAVRVSFSAFNTESEVARFTDVCRRLTW